MSFFAVNGRVALIVGAADPIGEAIATRLGKGGAKIVLVDSDPDKVDKMVKNVSNAGVRVEGKALDIRDSNQVKDAIEEISNSLGSIDILINAVDYCNCKPITEASLEDWNGAIDNNLLPVFLFSKFVIPKMQAKKYGRIVNISEITYLGMPGTSNYAAAKSGMFGFTRALALELAKDGITVNTVIKGDINVERKEFSEEELQKATAAIPVKRLGLPEDIAYAVSYFVSEKSAYTTGQMLFVRGGKSMYSSMSI